MIVLGSGLTVLGVIRLLQRAGTPAWVVGDGGPLARRSRWARRAPPSAGGLDPERDLAGYLAGLPFERAVVLPCSDTWVLRVARAAARIAPRFLSSVSSPDTLERLIDKWHLAEELTALGLPHPRTVVLDGGVDARVSDEILAGSFLKPRDSSRFFARFGVKAFRLSSREDLRQALARVAGTGLEVQLQEYVPGPPSNHYFVDGFVDRTGRVAGVLVRRRLRMYPRDFGNSTYFESVPVADAAPAVETVTRLLRHLRYRGVFSAEFKRDSRDGVFRLIEVNVRPWWYVEFAGRCGMDVCALAVRDALGEMLPPQPYATGRRCVYPYYDFFACREEMRAGQLSAGAWLRSWLTAEQPVFRWSDPWPAVSAASEILGGRLRRALGAH